MYKVPVLPAAGVTAYFLGMSDHQIIALGLFIITLGCLILKLARFKVKDIRK